MSPVAWMEHLTPGNCVLCNEPRLTHDDAACARFTTDDELCVEMQYRYWSAGGLMPGEDGYDPAGDDNLTSDEATS